MNEVTIWYGDPTALADPQLDRACDELLTSEERAAVARFAYEEHRRERRLARAMLRTALSAQHPGDPREWRFELGEHGKPALWGESPLHFNVSHTAGLVMCAVTRAGEIGIDVERLGRRGRLLDIARSHFAPSESARVESAPVERQGEMFLTTWTLKEAYIKALGLGLTAELQSFCFDLDADPPRISIAGVVDERWWVRSMRPTPEHVAAVAVRTPAPIAMRFVDAIPALG